MKRVKCYGRAKSRYIDTSEKNAIFEDKDADVFSDQNSEAIFPDQDSESVFSDQTSEAIFSDIDSNWTLGDVSPHSKEETDDDKETQGVPRSNEQSPELFLYNDISPGSKSSSDSQKQALKNEKYSVKVRQRKYNLRCKKINQQRMHEINVSPIRNQPRWSSINEYSLNVEIPKKKKKKPISTVEFDFDDKENQDNIEEQVDGNVFNSPGHTSRNWLHWSEKSKKLSDNDTSVKKKVSSLMLKKSNKYKPSTPIPNKTVLSSFGRNAHFDTTIGKSITQKDKLITSTPAIPFNKGNKLNMYPFNISRISTIGNKNNLSLDLSFNSQCTVSSTTNSSKMLQTNKAHNVFLHGVNSPYHKAPIPQVYSSAVSGVSTKDVYNMSPNLSSKSEKNMLSSENMSMFLMTNKTHGSILSSAGSEKNSSNKSSRSCNIYSTIQDPAIKNLCHSRGSCNSLEKVLSANSAILSCTTDSDIECSLSKLLDCCQQDSVICFEELYDWSNTIISKIGEGTYGEVFMLTLKNKSSVLKIIPFSQENADSNLQSIETVFSEIKVSQCLSDLRSNKHNKTKNFNNLKNAYIVKGCYPSQLIAKWDVFSDAKTSYNYRPDFYGEEQLFAILEADYGGKDMTSFVIRNAVEAESIFKQIAISLAIAEEASLFEHRDLHLGNILVKRNNSKKISYVLRGKSITIPSEGLIVTIIDFTLSRVLDSGCVFYNNLADDESLFNQSGDYQFEIYKATRLHLNNEWQNCLLYSNTLWLTFLCVKLLEYKYSRTTSKKHRVSIENIKLFQSELASCKCALDCIKKCKIIPSIPERSQVHDSKLNSKAKFMDRKSFQKSSSCIRA